MDKVQFFELTRGNIGSKGVTILYDGEYVFVDASNEKYDAILESLEAGTDEWLNMAPGTAHIARGFAQVSDRMKIVDGVVYFDDDRVDSSLDRHIQRAYQESLAGGEKQLQFQSLVKFQEKVMQNIDKNSREQLYSWFKNHDFSITEDGDLIGYKSMQFVAGERVEPLHHGKNIINGVEYDGGSMVTGDVVSFPRSEVQNDPNVGCGTGLHFGTFNYALNSNLGGNAIATVIVHPADIISIPSDSGFQKVRCCRYKIHEITKKPEVHEHPLFIFSTESDSIRR